MRHIRPNLPADDPIGGKGKRREKAFSFLPHACRLSIKHNVVFFFPLSLSATILPLPLIVNLGWGKNAVEDGTLYNSTKQNPSGFTVMLSAAAFEGASQKKPQQFKDQGLNVTFGSINNVREWLIQLVCLSESVLTYCSFVGV